MRRLLGFIFSGLCLVGSVSYAADQAGSKEALDNAHPGTRYVKQHKRSPQAPGLHEAVDFIINNFGNTLVGRDELRNHNFDITPQSFLLFPEYATLCLERRSETFINMLSGSLADAFLRAKPTYGFGDPNSKSLILYDPTERNNLVGHFRGILSEGVDGYRYQVRLHMNFKEHTKKISLRKRLRSCQEKLLYWFSHTTPKLLCLTPNCVSANGFTASSLKEDESGKLMNCDVDPVFPASVLEEMQTHPNHSFAIYTLGLPDLRGRMQNSAAAEFLDAFFITVAFKGAEKAKQPYYTSPFSHVTVKNILETYRVKP